VGSPACHDARGTFRGLRATHTRNPVRFDHAGHLWPVASPPDREQELAEFGSRNQDIDMSDLVWEFFRSSL